jgi:hypothetical protein
MKYRNEQGKHRWYDFSSYFANFSVIMSMWSCMPFFIVVLGPLARVSKVSGKGVLSWCSVLQCLACLVEVDFGVARGHFVVRRLSRL